MRVAACLALALPLLVCQSGWAVIETLIPLANLQGGSHVIALARVERLDLEKQRAVLAVQEPLKGQFPSRLPLRLAGDNEGNPLDMLERIEVGQPLVLFITEGEAQDVCFAYTEGSWFQIVGYRDGQHVGWTFTHAEPYLRRTYHGTTDELVGLLQNALAGKGKLPDVDPHEKPGLGPKIGRTPVEILPDSDPVAEIEPPAAPSHHPPATTLTQSSPQPLNLRPWAVLATVLVGASGIAYLRLRNQEAE